MGKKILRIALFLPSSTPFYMSTFHAMKRGFETHEGVEVCGWTELLNEDAMLEFCRQFKPDVIFEMNRTRSELPLLPAHIKHIGWIVDPSGKDFDSFKGSEIVYFFSAHWIERCLAPPTGIVDWLAPGFCPETYCYKEKSPLCDFSFFGHIPLPWNSQERARIVHEKNGNILTFGQVYDHCLAADPITGWENVIALVEGLAGEPVEIEDRVVRYDIGCRASRMIKRHVLIDVILQVSQSLRIYGPENWAKYPSFYNYYQKFVTDQQELCHIVQTSKAILHEGTGLHFRVFDALGAGSCLFYLRHPTEFVHGGLQTFFEPGKHYVPFDADDITEVAAKYLYSEQARRTMARDASALVHAKHTWSHRAAKILADIHRIM